MEEKKRGRKRAVVGEEADVRPLRPINEVRRIKGGGTGGRPQARRGTSRPVRRMGGDWGAGGGRGMCAGEEEAHAKTSKSLNQQKFRIRQIATVGGGGNLVRSIEIRRWINV
jgi:hypothetical protein